MSDSSIGRRYRTLSPLHLALFFFSFFFSFLSRIKSYNRELSPRIRRGSAIARELILHRIAVVFTHDDDDDDDDEPRAGRRPMITRVTRVSYRLPADSLGYDTTPVFRSPRLIVAFVLCVTYVRSDAALQG